MKIETLLTRQQTWIRELGKLLLGSRYQVKWFDSRSPVAIDLKHPNKPNRIIQIEDNYTYYRLFIYSPDLIFEIQSFSSIKELAKYLKKWANENIL